MRSAAIVSTSPNPPVVPLHFIHLFARADADVVRSLLALVCCGLCGRALAQPAFAQFEARQTHSVGLPPGGGNPRTADKLTVDMLNAMHELLVVKFRELIAKAGPR